MLLGLVRAPDWQSVVPQDFEVQLRFAAALRDGLMPHTIEWELQIYPRRGKKLFHILKPKVEDLGSWIVLGSSLSWHADPAVAPWEPCWAHVDEMASAGFDEAALRWLLPAFKSCQN